MQVTPTEDATMTALKKEQLTLQVDQQQHTWQNFFWNFGSTLITSLALLVGGIIALFRWFRDRRTEREKRDDENFQQVVADLGDANEGRRVNATIMLRTFLQPNYERFHKQIFDLAVANLRSRPRNPVNPDAAEPLDTLSQPLIELFVISYSLAHKWLQKHQPYRISGPDASCIQLDNGPLDYCDLEWAYMPDASLRKAHLGMANLEYADLSRVHLEGADLKGTKLKHATLNNAHLKGAVFGTYIRGKDFTKTDLTGAMLVGADLSGVDLSETELFMINLTEAILTEATLTEVEFSIVNLTKAKLCHANLTKANFRVADLSGVDLTSANLMEADLSNTDLSGVNLTSANLTKANLSGAENLASANLSEANLMGADLSFADLTSANFTKVTLTGADLRSANLMEADLSNTDLSGVNLTSANLTKANLTKATLTGADLALANLTKANLSGANLSGVGDLLLATLLGTDLRRVKGLSKEQLADCKAEGAIIDEDPTTSASQPTVAPSSPLQSNNAQAPSALSAQVSTPPPDTDGSSATSSKPSPEP